MAQRALLAISHAGWPLLLGGIMKITYDLTLWKLYRHAGTVHGLSSGG